MFAKLFSPKCPLDEDEWEWLLAGIKWLEEEFPLNGQKVAAGPMILPLAEDFRALREPSPEYASDIFDRVKQLADMAEWPTEIRMQEAESGHSFASPVFAGEYRWSDALGTFSLGEDEQGSAIAIITYHPHQLSDPAGFVATMAHELGHYLMSTATRCPPGGWELHELATDLTAVWMGFGIFLSNSSKNFSAFSNHDQSGWQSSMVGYLNERTLLTAMAICASIRSEDVLKSLPYLKPYLAKDLHRIAKYVQQSDVFEQLSLIDLTDFGVEKPVDQLEQKLRNKVAPATVKLSVTFGPK